MLMINTILEVLMNIKNTNRPTLLVIAGPTAVGKTQYTIQLAQQYHCPIISADSRQFYREMRIGTAFPTDEELSKAQHYFVGNLSIGDYYSVSKFEQDVLSLLPSLFATHPIVIMTGGSGLYLDAVCDGIDLLPDPDMEIRDKVMTLFHEKGIDYLRSQLKLLDPDFYESADIANHKRLIRALEVCLQTGKPYSTLLSQAKPERNFNIEKYYLNRTRSVLFERINKRVDLMMELGLLDEVRSLLPYRHFNALNTVGYKELFDYIDNKISLEEAVDKIKTHTRRYAKRQLTWFKRQYKELLIED